MTPAGAAAVATRSHPPRVPSQAQASSVDVAATFAGGRGDASTALRSTDVLR